MKMKKVTAVLIVFLGGLTLGVDAFAEQSSQWDPFRELDQMRHTMDRMFQDVMTRGVSAGQPSGVFSFAPAMDLQKTDTGYILTADLPGVEKDKINVQVQNGVLTVSGERQTETQAKEQSFSRMERDFGSF